MYKSRLSVVEQLGVDLDSLVHGFQLRQELVARWVVIVRVGIRFRLNYRLILRAFLLLQLRLDLLLHLVKQKGLNDFLWALELLHVDDLWPEFRRDQPLLCVL